MALFTCYPSIPVTLMWGEWRKLRIKKIHMERYAKASAEFNVRWYANTIFFKLQRR
ncbi:MAG: hypothetical protein RI956_107 [Pseudomonadota bacterium]|jgi:hypothetical protein